MNRLALDTEPTFSTDTPAGSKILPDINTLERRRIDCAPDVAWSTFAPMHYEANYAYPLLVWLHGTAGNEHELRQVMPLVSMRNYVAVAPRGTWTDPRRRGQFGWRQTGDAIEQAEVQIAECVLRARERFNIHPQRIFLVGHGSGGTMALRAAWNEPHSFAGVAAINGPLPTQLQPFRRVNEIRRVPCLLATSRDSRTYPAARVCRDLRLLHSAGCTVALRQYPGGDCVTSTMLADLDRWLMELVCGASKQG